MGKSYKARLSWVSLLSVATDVNQGPIGQMLPYRDEFVLSSLFMVKDPRSLSQDADIDQYQSAKPRLP